MTLLLASKSATRRTILAGAGVPFESVAAPVDEDGEKARLLAAGCVPVALAEALASLKAKAAIAPAGTLVLGADQVLETADGSVLSKPRTIAEAAGQLRALAGTTHHLHSAAVLLRDGAPLWTGVETASLTMRAFSDSFLDAYLAQEWDAVRYGVGGYRIEGPGAQLFERVDGSHFAILGLPLLPLLAALRRTGEMAS